MESIELFGLYATDFNIDNKSSTCSFFVYL